MIAGPSRLPAPSSWSEPSRTVPPCLDDPEPDDTLEADLATSLAIVALCGLAGAHRSR